VQVMWMGTRSNQQNERSLFSDKLLSEGWICANSVVSNEGGGWEAYPAAFSLVEVGAGPVSPPVELFLQDS